MIKSKDFPKIVLFYGFLDGCEMVYYADFCFPRKRITLLLQHAIQLDKSFFQCSSISAAAQGDPISHVGVGKQIVLLC